MDKNQHNAKLLESTKTSSTPLNRLFFWSKKHQQKSEHFIAVCLHVHKLSRLPFSREGQFIVATWKSSAKESETDKTMPIEVSRGEACFDEVFLHYCNGIEDACSILRGITVTISLVCDGAEYCEVLGEFRVDLSEVVLGESFLNAKNGGEMVSVDVDDDGFDQNGGVLSVGVYCRVLDEEEEDEATDHSVGLCSNYETSKKNSKNKCFSCLPDFKKLRILPKANAQTSEKSVIKQAHHSDNNKKEEEEDLEAGGFITLIERGVVFHGNPPSDEEFEDVEDDDDDDDEGVEDEFLRMLEMKCWKKKGLSDENEHMSLDLLVKEAEGELQRAAQVWRRRRVGGEMMEREEYEELMMMNKRSWRRNEKATTSSTSCFGSPF